MNHETAAHTPETLRRFLISETGSQRPLVVVEAYSEAQAAGRGQAVAHVARLETTELGMLEWDIQEMHPAEPATVPFFTEGYFLMLEAQRTRGEPH